MMTSYRVTYRDADGHRTERVVGSSGRPTGGTVVWRVPTNLVESYYDLDLGAGQRGD